MAQSESKNEKIEFETKVVDSSVKKTSIFDNNKNEELNKEKDEPANKNNIYLQVIYLLIKKNNKKI